MKEIFLIRRDAEFMWIVKDHRERERIDWGSKYSTHCVEFKTFDEAKKHLDLLPLHNFISGAYFEIVKLYRKK